MEGSTRWLSQNSDKGTDPGQVTTRRQTQDSARGQDEFDGRCSGLEPDGQQAWSAITAWILWGDGLGLCSEAAFPEVEGVQRNGLAGAELGDGQARGREARQSIHPEFACGSTGSRSGADG